MALKLIKFRTRTFRSIDDSGWVDLDDVTALVGINESGKTNLLLSLWKLNPAREGAIDPIPDFPRDRYNEIRAMETKPVFITVRFVIDDALAAQIAAKTKLDAKQFNEVEVNRRLDGKFTFRFPNCEVPRTLKSDEFKQVLDAGRKELEGIEAFQNEGDLKDRMLEALDSAGNALGNGEVGRAELAPAISLLSVARDSEAKTSKIVPVYDDAIAQAEALLAKLKHPEPTSVEGVWELVKSDMPKFVFYASYGNLDSEIYLPHVIENIEREDLGERESAKSRTLKVLFEFVNLSAKEILELGTEIDVPNPTDEQIEADAKRKKEREILLMSASTQLTGKFRDWWKQGIYRFRFNADGNHFRIWVSDDVRPEEIELEGRSTGLQWFFSFYLVFLVESQDTHEGTVLLLDEAGLSLHPLAQRDLSTFFASLPNQIVYTTHSPFLMEHDALDQVRSVFTDDTGRTVVSPDLRANPKFPAAKKSIYPVHVALGLSVSDTFLIGCIPIVVEGVSDQRYLTAIKNYLIGRGKITPSKDIVFLPAGGTGTKGVTAVVSIVTAKDEQLPRLLIDSDGPGDSLKQRLLSGTYEGNGKRIKQVCDYGVVENGEIEDLMPAADLAKVVTRFLPRPAGSDEEFEEIVDDCKPIIPQIKAYCEKHDIELELGWKVEVATLFKKRLGTLDIDQTIENRWTKVFDDFLDDA